ncbi:DUF4844 domain-containing protein [Mucilaginibacter segetis]|uniref:DUF4844 domain-containing protein n=1 Tax=Mucilaginibacter segetis TaxID=2793071 RepID=A0A934UN94_9SPHI|nr:DUF4844 domain-containing protein [Mucilaginibacter segetis]MBK0380558.1 DUF4844 domain-containing protein [Mucilaginibacter segetis]
MKQTIGTILGLILMTSTSCAQQTMDIPPNATNNLKKFKLKEKFVEDSTIFYPGIGDPKLRPILTQKINAAADDFEKVTKKDKTTAKDFQQKIKTGLERFSDINLDTEDRERICFYFEELMDIVGLQSSDGLLNTFMYGFDPEKAKQKE